MNLTASAQATLLLTSYFSSAKTSGHKPLTNAEWGKFALWLKHQRLSPASLLVPEPQTLLSGWNDPCIPLERLVGLLGRGHSLALAVEKWQRAGLWVITRADADYPQRLKNNLRNDSPAVLFGCGNKALLKLGGVAIVGSRNAVEEDLNFTSKLAKKLADHGLNVVSGGARGIDECAMLSSLNAGGTATGVLTDSLLKATTSVKWRNGLASGSLALISPFYPEVGFNVANAMARNKYVYCLAESAIVVHAGKKGGTVTGALEAIKHRWVPVWVKPSKDENSSNAMIVQKGAAWLLEAIDPLKLNRFSESDSYTQPELFSLHEELAGYAARPKKGQLDFYHLFLEEIQHLALEPVAKETLADVLGVVPEQLDLWLDRAINEKRLQQLADSGLYQIS
jgi:predicted Rossmann fold nucleotide-binding protein DprA/Smf involved in DNA uptake